MFIVFFFGFLPCSKEKRQRNWVMQAFFRSNISRNFLFTRTELNEKEKDLWVPKIQGLFHSEHRFCTVNFIVENAAWGLQSSWEPKGEKRRIRWLEWINLKEIWLDHTQAPEKYPELCSNLKSKLWVKHEKIFKNSKIKRKWVRIAA